MTIINKSALVSYSAEKLFQLVDDIDAYPDFLPWCNASEVLSRTDDEVKARLDLTKGAIHKSFTTINRMQKNKMIEMRLLEGPFHHFEGFWRFESLEENACKISLDMDFEFSSKMVGLMMGPLFNQIANTLVDSFCKRAKDIYG